MNKDVIILIPAYNPNENLIRLVYELCDRNKILVVNDGSQDEVIFNKIEKYCTIIEHARNQGKGQALKTGFKYILNNYKNIIGVVTADADGQHQVEDIEKVKLKLIENQDKLILGCRNFECKKVPWKSKIGNKTINFLFKLKTGKKIKDTQTGLRGIPYEYLSKIENISGKRFEYEMNVLDFLSGIMEINEIDINTIYNKEIKTTYKLIKDSLSILKNFII